MVTQQLDYVNIEFVFTDTTAQSKGHYFSVKPQFWWVVAKNKPVDVCGQILDRLISLQITPLPGYTPSVSDPVTIRVRVQK